MIKIGIIGSTNVGKSTLFNRLIGSHRAIVTDVHGTTRDILYHTTEKRIDDETEISITFLDTPGLDTFEEEIPYIKTVIEEADMIFFVIDHHVGFGSKEQEIYQLLNKAGKKSESILLVNKLEKAFHNHEEAVAIAEYVGYGFYDVYPIVAKSKKGLEAIWSHIGEYAKNHTPDTDHEEDDSTNIPLAILGKPNAGKSTLLNTLLGEERALVSDIPGTTLDYNVGTLTYNGVPYTLYDTAGIRKKGKILGLERIAYKKTLSMLEYVRPYVIYMINGDEGLTHRDMTLLEEIMNIKLPLIIALNKIDKLSEAEIKEYHRLIHISFQFAKYIPIIDVSAQEGDGIDTIFSILQRMRKERHEKIATPDLNRAIRKALIERPPSFTKSRACKISYITQIETQPPTFMAFVNDTKKLNFQFKKRTENTIRIHTPFVGKPIRILRRNKQQDKEDENDTKENEQEEI